MIQDNEQGEGDNKAGGLWYRRWFKSQEQIKHLTEALKQAENFITAVDLPSRLDPHHSEEIRELGKRIGYGALMHGASALWRLHLEAEGLSGGEFVVGPCQKTASNACIAIRKAIESATNPIHSGEQ